MRNDEEAVAVSGGGLDPEIAGIRQRQAATFPAFDVTKLPIDEGRRLHNEAAMFLLDDQPAVTRTQLVEIPSVATMLRARLYRPDVPAGNGAILYLHGGGWFAMSIDTHDGMLRRLAVQSGMAVLAVDYRLAPENPFPAGLQDCVAAWRWLRAQAAGLGLDPERLFIAGDSAGANLALATCVSERDSGRPLPAGMALFYGCYAPVFATGSHLRNGDGRYGISTARMRWYWEQYLGPQHFDPELAERPPLPRNAAPLWASVTGLPPAYLTLAELDPLADDTMLLSQHLAAARVPCTLDRFAGAPHGFLALTKESELARKGMQKACDWLKAAGTA
jgi:acetyl esterase